MLLVEDDAGDAFLVKDLLAEGDGFDVVWAASLAEAATVSSAGVECALVDLNLPDATGLDALRLVGAAFPNSALVVLTGMADRTLGLAAVAAGAQDYLIKDEVTAGLLDRTVRYAIERRLAEKGALALAQAAVRQQHNERITRGLLPQLRVHDASLDLATRYVPGNVGEVLGGDFLDAVELPDGTVRMIIGDVAGHGPDEAAIGVNLRIAWRTLTLAGIPSGPVIGRLQDMLIHDVGLDDLFVTATDLTLSPDRSLLTARYAGHPAPLLITEDGVTDLDGPRAPVLGVAIDDIPPEVLITLPKRWRLLCFTDGLIEGHTPDGPRWGAEGLVRSLAANPGALTCSLGELADLLLREASQLNSGPLADDVALLLAAHDRR